MDGEIERFELQVREEGGWVTSLTGTYTGWLLDRISGGDREEGLEYRIYDSVTHQVMSVWNSETEQWDECPTLTPEEGVIPEVTVQQTLADVHDEGDERRIAVEALCTRHGISLRVQGHGDKTSPEGHGMPVLVELQDGEVWVHVWADVNQEDPTHSISLAGARDSCRDARPMFVQTEEPTCDEGTFTRFGPFAGKVGDRVLVGDPDPSDRYEGEIVDLIPAQRGFNGPMVTVRDDDGRTEAVAVAAIEEVYPQDA